MEEEIRTPDTLEPEAGAAETAHAGGAAPQDAAAGEETAPAESSSPDGEEQEEKKKDAGAAVSMFYWLQTLVTAVVVIVLVFTFVGRVTRVVGSSMLDTLHDGDMLLVQSLGYSPDRGDVVVLNKTCAEFLQGEPIVKRIIATGGQRVDIDYAAGVVYVDGEPLDEPYVLERMVRPESEYKTQTSFLVPEGCLFVMGDNRNGSTDSRDVRLGVIDERYVLGRAVAVIFPFSDIQLL